MWNTFAQSYSISITAIPKEAPNQLGVAEKHAHLIKLGYLEVRNYLGESWVGETVLSLSIAAHNATPLSFNGMALLYMVLGRNPVCALPPTDL